MKAKAERNTPQLIGELLSMKEDGRVKLYLIHKALKTRREHAVLFQEGDYVPVETVGAWKEHVVAYARRHEQTWALTVAPRFFFALAGEGNPPLGEETWQETALLLPEQAPERWSNALTGDIMKGLGSLRVAEILRGFPEALLTGEGRLSR